MNVGRWSAGDGATENIKFQWNEFSTEIMEIISQKPLAEQNIYND